MLKRIAVAAVAALVCGPALAGGVDYGRNDSRAARHGRNRTGAWIGDNRHPAHNPHGPSWGGGHGHFSPRGQGGHHWGW